MGSRSEALAKALGARRNGAGWLANCPSHDDTNPSLAINEAKDGKTLVHCHGGCSQEKVVNALKSSGLWPNRGSGTSPMPNKGVRRRRPDVTPQLTEEERLKRKQALSIWGESQPAVGTQVEVYLLSRGITVPPPASLRFHPGLRHPTDGQWPAMVALVSHAVTGEPIGILRTFLERDGNGKAPVAPQKMALGPCRGGIVQLAEIHEFALVSEGIETALSALQASRLPALTALSAGNMRSLKLPPMVREIVVLADPDAAGVAAAQACALRWQGEGRKARIAMPPGDGDFNDVLMAGMEQRRTPQ